MGIPRPVICALCCLLLISCAGLDIEGEVAPEAVVKFHEFKSGLSGKVGSARVRVTGARGFTIPGDTDRLDQILEIISQATLLSAATDIEFKKPSVSIFLLWPNGETYGSVSMILDRDEIRKPEILIHYGGWHFQVRAAGLPSLGRRWVDTSY